MSLVLIKEKDRAYSILDGVKTELDLLKDIPMGEYTLIETGVIFKAPSMEHIAFHSTKGFWAISPLEDKEIAAETIEFMQKTIKELKENKNLNDIIELIERTAIDFI